MDMNRTANRLNKALKMLNSMSVIGKANNGLMFNVFCELEAALNECNAAITEEKQTKEPE